MQCELAAVAGSCMRRLWHMHQLRYMLSGLSRGPLGFTGPVELSNRVAPHDEPLAARSNDLVRPPNKGHLLRAPLWEASVEEAQHLASDLLPPGLLVILYASRDQ